MVFVVLPVCLPETLYKPEPDNKKNRKEVLGKCSKHGGGGSSQYQNFCIPKTQFKSPYNHTKITLKFPNSPVIFPTRLAQVVVRWLAADEDFLSIFEDFWFH